MSVKTKTNLFLDLAIFTVFLISANPHLTGNTIREWLSMSFGAAILTHLLFHWDWLVSVTKTFSKNLFSQSRLNYVVDLLFLIAMTATTLTSLLSSKSIMSTSHRRNNYENHLQHHRHLDRNRSRCRRSICPR